MIAQKTLELIASSIERDNGNAFRAHLRNCIPLAEDAYREAGAPFRAHLGASLIGRECPRELWLSFRWACVPTFDARMQRLFNRGHLEEARFVALLLTIGCEVWQLDSNGKQFRIHGHKGHFGGSMDSVIRGIPEMPDEPMIGEFKTHNDKSFKKLQQDGVRKAKFEHFVQMQIYMGKNSLKYALYLAVNKNDDDIYAEIVPFDEVIYGVYLDRSVKIIEAELPPPKINENPSWYVCKFCDKAKVCHGKEPPVKTCRTCKHAIILESGVWGCTRTNTMLSEEEQLNSCTSYDRIFI